jgi:hypothetical protein
MHIEMARDSILVSFSATSKIPLLHAAPRQEALDRRERRRYAAIFQSIGEEGQ